MLLNYHTILLSHSAQSLSGQFPELHARICKTYLDALQGDKSLSTLYGAIVGLSSLGNHAVRTLLLSNLPAIQDRLQAESIAGGGGSGGGKRKRAGSMDQTESGNSGGAEGGVSSVGATATATVGVKFSKSSASKMLQEQVAVGMCKEALIRALGLFLWYICCLGDFSLFLLVRDRLKVTFLRHALCLPLLLATFDCTGKYIAYSVKLPVLGQRQARGGAAGG